MITLKRIYSQLLLYVFENFHSEITFQKTKQYLDGALPFHQHNQPFLAEANIPYVDFMMNRYDSWIYSRNCLFPSLEKSSAIK